MRHIMIPLGLLLGLGSKCLFDFLGQSNFKLGLHFHLLLHHLGVDEVLRMFLVLSLKLLPHLLGCKLGFS